jgi:hypothetical protein
MIKQPGNHEENAMVNFRIGFTVSAETLFSLVAKAIPQLQDLHVEEVIEPQAVHEVAQANKVARAMVKSVTHEKKKDGRGRELSLNKGLNQIILDLLSDGKPHKAPEIKPLAVSQGFSVHSIGSRMEALRKHKIVFQPQTGYWKLVAKAEVEETV